MEIDTLFAIAIEREVEANRFYTAVAQKMHNAGVRAAFSELAQEEYGHMELLEKYKHDPTLELIIAAPGADFKIAEGAPLPKLSLDLKPADAMALAMKKEQQAVEFYRLLAQAATDSGLQDVLNNLVNMELGHKQRLETMFVNIGYPEVF
jgi:rubrerythrin